MIWHSSKIEDVLAELKTDKDKGLSNGEALNRLNLYGPNKLKGKKKATFFERFINQMKDFMVLILIFAAAVSLITTIIEQSGEWFEPLIIVGIVLLNAFIGAYQENKAEESLNALQSMVAPSAKVIRDGVLRVISAADLVPGDIISIEAGDFIPADCRIIESATLRSDESALTGESVPVEKIDAELEDITPLADRTNMLYSGCSVTYGRGTAVVTGTGMQSEVGKIASLIDNAGDTMTPLKQKLASLGKILGFGVLIICAVVFLVGLIFQKSDLPLLDRMIELFMTSVALAVAAIPEGLPAIVTVVLALGVNRMVKRNAIIKNLPAVETLGSASVICSDKTGTLTQNKMTVKALYDGNTVAADNFSDSALMLLRLGAMCTNGKVYIENGKEVSVGDPTETGIISATMKYCLQNKDEIEAIYPRLAEAPFDSDRKLMTTVNMINGKPFAVTKGAPDILMQRCTAGNIKGAKKASEAMGRNALRVIAVAIKPLDSIPGNPSPEILENNLTLVGLIGLIDPPRPEAKEAVKICRRAGIRTVMITGDHITTATAIAKELGVLKGNEKAVTGAEIEKLTDEEFSNIIEDISVYARVTPEDKIRIVKLWQKKGHIVAMTGDGVNDAPALKAADIGCAMGVTGTDVAKGAADMTLTDDNFATIVSAVKEGRGIFDNIRKTAHYLISCNIGEVLSVFLGMIIFKMPIFAAIQLLWINLVSDTAPALALGLENAEYDIMERKPRAKNEGIFSGGLGIDVVWQGAVFGIITLVSYAVGLKLMGSGAAETMAFLTLAFSQIIHAFDIRSEHSLFKAGFFSNKFMLGAAGISTFLIFIIILTPLRSLFKLELLTATEFLVAIALAFVPFIASEIEKLVKYLIKKYKKPKAFKETENNNENSAEALKELPVEEIKAEEKATENITKAQVAETEEAKENTIEDISSGKELKPQNINEIEISYVGNKAENENSNVTAAEEFKEQKEKIKEEFKEIKEQKEKIKEEFKEFEEEKEKIKEDIKEFQEEKKALEETEKTKTEKTENEEKAVENKPEKALNADEINAANSNKTTERFSDKVLPKDNYQMSAEEFYERLKAGTLYDDEKKEPESNKTDETASQEEKPKDKTE